MSISRLPAIGKSIKPTSLFLALAAAFCFLERPAFAQTWNKTSGGPYSWNDSNNWTGGGYPNASGETANVNNSITAAMTLNLNEAITIGIINLGSNTNSNPFTIAPGASGSFTWNRSGGSNQFQLNVGGSNVTHIISAGVNLADGNGHSVSNLAGSTAGVTISGLVTNNGGSRTLTNNLLSGNLLTLSGGVNLSQDNTGRTLTFGGSGHTFVSGIIANGGTSAGSIVKSGAGILTLANAGNSYTGEQTLNDGVVRVLAVGGSGEIGGWGGAATPLGNGAVVFNGTSGSQFPVIQAVGTGNMTFTRQLAQSGNLSVRWVSSDGSSSGQSGGWAAEGGILNVRIVDSSGNLISFPFGQPAWTTRWTGGIVFGSTTATHAVIFENNIDFLPQGATVSLRPFYVIDNPNAPGNNRGILIGNLSSSTGASGLRKEGDGVLEIQGASNTYTNSTEVNGGKLIVNNPNNGGSGTGTGAVTVNATGTLGGSGYIIPTNGTGGANVILNNGTGSNAGGRVDPGDRNTSNTPTTGTLTIGSATNNATVTFNANNDMGLANRINRSSRLVIDVNGSGGAGHDRLDIPGNLVLNDSGSRDARPVLDINLFGGSLPNFDTLVSGAALNTSINMAAGVTNQSLTANGMVIATYTGTLTATANGPFMDTNGNLLAQGATINSTGNAYAFQIWYLADKRIVLTAVPEPSSLALLGIALGCTGLAWRRKGRQIVC